MNGIIKDNMYWGEINGYLQPLWDILKELPQGWQIDNKTDASLPYTVFVNNGKSVLSGEKKTALLVIDVEKFNNYINTKNKKQ